MNSSSQNSLSKLSKTLLLQTFGLNLRGVENAIETPVSTFSPSLIPYIKFFCQHTLLQ